MFANLLIGRRLALAFAAVIAVFLVVVAMGLRSGSKLQQAEALNVHTYEVIGSGNDLLQAMLNIQTGARGFLLSGSDSFLAPYQVGLTAFDKSWAEARRMTADNPAQQRRLEDMQSQQQEFKRVSNELIALRQQVSAGSKTPEDLLTAFSEGRDKAAMDGFRALHAEFDKTERDLLVSRATEAAAVRSMNFWVMVLGSALAVVAAGLLGLWVTRSITRPIQRAVDVARTVATGDLGSRIEVDSTDEPGQLLAALRDMNQSLVTVVSTVRASSDSIATGSSQIATGNADLSQRTEEQASNLQQTAASMEELASTVRLTADTAREANSLAGAAREAATRGGEVVGRVVHTMDEISKSSRRISDIIGVIDGIAFQTNILALNAAVEAARAGEQGRGFAVVAGEVRLLAQRSAEAAREIKTLIGESVERVEAGGQLVSDAGASMGDIVDQVRRVADLISEISNATVEQTTGIGQVSEAVGQLDQVTQQNAALVEESAAAAESLKHQASRLVEAVGVFRM
ncbi:MAG: methyl-accepting chemotaxis protein [Roseateles sp.]|uniref:methyl-accepting chemotaxis protein n=1 Tax=Roseateles sp. TaxID=1971397 RepID=UPI004035EDA1